MGGFAIDLLCYGFKADRAQVIGYGHLLLMSL